MVREAPKMQGLALSVGTAIPSPRPVYGEADRARRGVGGRGETGGRPGLLPETIEKRIGRRPPSHPRFAAVPPSP